MRHPCKGHGMGCMWLLLPKPKMNSMCVDRSRIIGSGPALLDLCDPENSVLTVDLPALQVRPVQVHLGADPPARGPGIDRPTSPTTASVVSTRPCSAADERPDHEDLRFPTTKYYRRKSQVSIIVFYVCLFLVRY